MPAWEHLVIYLTADAEQEMQFLQHKWPGTQFPKYAAQALMPKLDMLGAQGWELVSCEPVIVGMNGDIQIGNASMNHWTALYLCIFKRPRQQE
ncbi:MAG TPA: hypothetical protein VH540_12140 [Ktedonobacterales bacterium]|jgi:hypothetical protein